MSSQAECESRLQNLQQYIPFLQKMLQRLDNTPGINKAEQKQKMTSLLTVITSSGQQLRPETLDRCEEVLSKMYLKFEGEDINRFKAGNSSGHFHSNAAHHHRTESHWSGPQINRPIKIERIDSSDLVVQDDETPRSPSPEETNRVSSSYVPISIPVAGFQAMDTDERINQPFGHGNVPKRDYHGCGPSSRVSKPREASPRSLRNEPIEIPLRSLPSEDQDYRLKSYERVPPNQRQLAMESRTGPYKAQEGPQSLPGLMELSPAAVSSPKLTSTRFGESRFNPPYDRDNRRDYSDTNTSQLHHSGLRHKDRPHPNNHQPMRVDRSGNGTYDRDSSHQHYQRYNEDIPSRPDDGRRVGPYRDVDFRSSPNQPAPVSHQRSPTRVDRWHKGDELKKQPGPFDNVWESFSTTTSSPFLQSNDWGSGSAHDRSSSIGNSSSGWSPGDSPASTSRGPPYEWDSSKGCPPVNRGFRGQCDDRNQYGRNLDQYPSQGSRPSYGRPHSSGPHHPPRSSYSGNHARPAGPSPAPRREDPRLANRPKPIPPAPTPSPSPSPSPSETSSQSNPNSRSTGPRDRRTPPPPKCTEARSGSQHRHSGSDIDRNPTKTGSSESSTAGSKDEFASPLNSLYSSNYSNVSQTGKGYGSQPYRIPKKNKTNPKTNPGTSIDKNPPAPQQLPVDEVAESAADSCVPPPSEVSNASAEQGKSAASSGGPTTTEESKMDETPPIPIEAIQNYLKTVLPQDMSDHVLKQLEKAKDSGSSAPAKATSDKQSQIIYDTDTTDEEAVRMETSKGAEVSSNAGEKQSASLALQAEEGAESANTADLENEASSSADVSIDQVPVEAEKKKGRKKKNATSSLELARLREDLVDYMPNLEEISGRRRSRSQRATQEKPAVHVEDSDSDVRIFSDSGSPTKRSPQTEQARRKRGRPPRTPEQSIQDPDPEVPAVPVDASEVDSITSEPLIEPPVTGEEAPLTIALATGGPKQGKRKKKGPANGRKKAKVVNDGGEAGAEGGQKKGAANKKKKTFTPTRLSLRGKRSMYENEEVTDPETSQQNENASSSTEEYFQCKECEFLGQKIIHHYVNEHPSVEIPFATISEAQWPSIFECEATESPEPVNAELLRDLSWIPARHSVATPTFCRLCTYSTCLRSEMMEHMMTHALPNDCKYRCNICAQSEGNFFDMFDHVTAHTGEYRYQCNYCNYRVSRRACIKQHMASLHGSQDVLFYNVALPDVNHLWIDGHVCLTCRYVQINGEQLDRHVTQSNSCSKEHKKVNLISVVRSESDAVPDIALQNSGEIAVFLCPSLETACAASETCPTDVNELASSLRKSSVPLIEKLVEKLNKEDAPEADSPSLVPPPVLTRRPVTTLRRESTTGNSESVEEGKEVENETRPDEAVTDSSETPSAVPESWMKSTSSLLATTISKLTDKLGNACDSNPTSPRPSSPEDLMDSDGCFADGELADSSSSSLGETEEEEEEEDSEEESDEERGADVVDVEDSDDGCLMIDTNKEAEETSSLPCIADVVSLNTGGLGIENDLDPIRTVLPFSNVIIAKDECTFPYQLPHDRPMFAMQLKRPNMYQKMLEQRRIRDFFKCMAFNCIFSSDSASDFSVHLDWHRTEFLSPHLTQAISEHRTLVCAADKLTKLTLSFPDFYLCPYCPEGASSAEELISHLGTVHVDCLFQCSACFFRSWSSKIVSVHIGAAHSDKPSTQVLKCNQIPSTYEPADVAQLTLSDLPRYQCSFENCSFACHYGSNYADHLRQSHQSIQTVNCTHCTSPVDCTSDEYVELLRHLNSHGIGYFQCAFCHWASELAADMLRHLCLTHPSCKGKVLIRSPASGSSPIKTLARFLPPRLHPFGQPTKDPHDPTNLCSHLFRELFSFVEIVECDVKVDEDVRSAPSGVNTENSEPDASKAENSPKTGTEFYGFGEEERAKAKENTESIMAEANEDDADAIAEENAAALGAEESESPSDDNGLSGHNLYKCGNAGCDYTAETSNELKDHLLVCDLARDSRLLTCHHCGRSMKQVSNLLEHLKVHGPKRYSCGLCGHRGPVAISIRKHMKTVHRCGVVDMLPVARGPVNADSGRFTFYPKDMAKKLQESRIRARNAAANKKQNNVYSYEDIAKIPIRSILPFNVECKHCGYTSKVRINIIRHLSLHEKNAERSSGSSSEREELVPRVIIPELAPVNPVPHLEGKEKMFDKMTNFAFSSHAREGIPAPPKMAGRMGIAGEKEVEDPAFIPDHLRFICGFEGCSHLTGNESLLKYHLQALHKDGTFTCPHCLTETEDSSGLSADAYRNHLKIHGPRLYRCGHCVFHHWQTTEIERHLNEKHSNRSPWQITVREPTDVEVRNSSRSQSSSKATDSNALPWHCSMCKQASASHGEIVAHVKTSHGIMSQYKCALCPVRSDVRSEFDRHFGSRHPDHEVQVLSMFYRMDETEKKSTQPEPASRPFVAKPLWKKNEPRLRHIRGILLEDEEVVVVKTELVEPPDDPVYGPYGTPSNGLLCCPMCKTYCVAYSRDFKDHLFRELQYKKFLCSKCSFGGASRMQVVRHVEKQHAKEGAFIREIAPNQPLEDWVEKVVKSQIAMLKKSKSGIGPTKAKKSVPSTSGGATGKPPVSSAASSNAKAKKGAAASTVEGAVKVKQEPSDVDTIHVELEPMDTSKSEQFEFTCPICPFKTNTLLQFRKHEATHRNVETSKEFSCKFSPCGFQADSELLLETHIRFAHSKEASSTVCLQCGMKASDKQTLAEHFKKTGHSKCNDLGIQTTSSNETVDSKEGTLGVAIKKEMGSSPTKTPRKGRSKAVMATLPYCCKHCDFRGASENGINLHWQRCHAADNKPLDFGYEPQPGTASGVKVNYKCQHCNAQGQFGELKKHSEAQHPNMEVRIIRVTGKKRSSETVDLTVDEPVAKKNAEDVIAAASTSGETSTRPSSPGLEVVFVVAPPPPQFICNWCQARFSAENEIIRHHIEHPSSLALRYTRVDYKSSAVEPGQQEATRSIMEIRFGCPICKKRFESLGAARSHVGDHQQAWKCGHCVQLFASPTNALQHIKEAHPGQQGRLESIDSPSLVAEKLTKGITMHRIQVNMKSMLREKPHHGGSHGESADNKEVSSHHASTPPSSLMNSKDSDPILGASSVRGHPAVARKSASVNLFLRESVKQEGPSVVGEVFDASGPGPVGRKRKLSVSDDDRDAQSNLTERPIKMEDEPFLISSIKMEKF